MLAIAEVLQTARAVAPDATVRNLTQSEQVPLPAEAGKGQRLASVDVPKVLVEFGEAKRKATVTLYLDPLDRSRWLADTVLGGRRVRTVVVLGGHQVVEEIAKARAAAGLPEPTRPPKPTSLSFGGEA